jgi:hypothetical protein
MERRTVQAYMEADGLDIKKRRERWGSWTNSAEHMRERQRRHRLRTETKPHEFADKFTDPLELAHVALRKLVRIRRAIPATSPVHDEVEEVSELIRQLAHGPQEGPSRPALPEPAFDLTTPAGRGRLGQHRRWHASGKRPCTCRSRP